MTTETWLRRGSLVLLGGCVLLLALTLAGIGRAAGGVSGATGYLAGESVDVPAHWFAGGDTLLVFLRSDCAASQGLAALLPDLRLKLPSGVSMVAVVSAASPEHEVAFARGAGFETAAIRLADFERLRLRVVPTLVLVDRNGLVRMERLGTATGLGRFDVPSELARLVSGS